eukprot:CAMPEP_0194041092 /NCGR_PEP_ID=MMETSP0009_2-20130614/12997_1 /TAXON_ID=210454 /ORGANISM="Grammatophora oceanica, Strain CCMP 410" /LENGTH=541 /DNA_ID=CAMNT_0038684445 /DNA_START=38 /DNA_END=1663 /DNA_ORIENTATION=+
MTNRVALIGSSGGGIATLGHTDAVGLLQTIHKELLKVEGSEGIETALFVSLHGGKGLDAASENDTATLYEVTAGPNGNSGSSGQCPVQISQTGTLKEVNNVCREADVKIAKAIRSKRVSALICISCDVQIHAETLHAAADMGIPVTGSGGTSLSSAASQFNVHLVGNAGGSVATTSYTRAVSYTDALATAWKKPYKPFSASLVRPQWRSVLKACLPAFWAVALTIRMQQMFGLDDEDSMVQVLRRFALPTTCCVVTATSCAPQYESIVIMASIVASMACRESIIAGLVAGWLVSLIVGRTLFACVRLGIPATMTNLLVAGGVGAVVFLLTYPVAPFLGDVSAIIRWLVRTSMSGQIPGVGFAMGCFSCYGSKVGYYHALWLPIILIEMEFGSASLWGTIDECTLVLVSAGICAGNLAVNPRTPSDDHGQGVETDVALCRRGLRINLLYGDFIEAAYPFMERSVVVNVAGYLASGISTELLTGNPTDVLSMAYLPLPVSIWLAKDMRKLSISYASAFTIAFLGTVVANLLPRRNRRKAGKNE